MKQNIKTKSNITWDKDVIFRNFSRTLKLYFQIKTFQGFP